MPRAEYTTFQPAILDAVAPTRIPAGTFYRSVDYGVIRKLGVAVLDGTHAGTHGARFNSPGSPPTTYLAGSQTLAALECEQDRMVESLTHPASPPGPRLTCAVEVEGLRVLDLTNPLVLATLGVAQPDLMEPSLRWRLANERGVQSVAQYVGAAARSAMDGRGGQKFDGIQYETWFHVAGLPRLVDLVLFMEPHDGARHRNPSVRLSLLDPEGLI